MVSILLYSERGVLRMLLCTVQYSCDAVHMHITSS